MAKMLKISGYSISVTNAFLEIDCDMETFLRIKTLKEVGYPLNELLNLYMAEGLSRTDALIDLLHAGCNLMDIGIILRYQLGITDENEAKSQLEALDITPIEVAVIIKIVYGKGATVTSQLFMDSGEVIRILRFVFGLPRMRASTILQSINFPTDDLEERLDEVYDSEFIIATQYLSKFATSIDFNALTGIDRAWYFRIMNAYSVWCFKYSDYRDDLDTWENVYAFTPESGSLVSIVNDGIQEIAQESLDILKGIRYTVAEATNRSLTNNSTNNAFVEYSAADNAYKNSTTQEQYLPHALYPLNSDDELVGYIANPRSADAPKVEQLGVKYQLNLNISNIVNEAVLQSTPNVTVIKIANTAIFEGVSFCKDSKGLPVEEALVALKNAGYNSALIGNVLYSIYEIKDVAEATRLLIEGEFLIVDIIIILHKVYNQLARTTMELLSPFGFKLRDMAEYLGSCI